MPAWSTSKQERQPRLTTANQPAEPTSLEAPDTDVCNDAAVTVSTATASISQHMAGVDRGKAPKANTPPGSRARNCRTIASSSDARWIMEVRGEMIATMERGMGTVAVRVAGTSDIA